MFEQRRQRRLDALLADHVLAVREFVERASALDETQWLTPRAEGKWTPAQETQHVILAYETFLRELSGGEGMRQHGSTSRRLIARMIGLTSILWRKKIPVAVNAPRGLRPEWVSADRAELLPALSQRGGYFDEAFAHAWQSDPRRRLTHYLFGKLSLDQAIRLMSVHTRHHAAFLPASARSVPSFPTAARS
jgi:uncharacterized damage-inducible protein DinB